MESEQPSNEAFVGDIRGRDAMVVEVDGRETNGVDRCLKLTAVLVSIYICNLISELDGYRRKYHKLRRLHNSLHR